MSKFCLAEIAVLIIGWLTNFLFLLYSEGVFSGRVNWDWMQDEAFLTYAAILAVPYAFTFLSCYLLRRFVKIFLILSLYLTIGSTCLYYGAYLIVQTPDPGRIFRLVPLGQTLIAAAFTLVVFLFGLVFRPKPAAA